jgi:hypothetical protein
MSTVQAQPTVTAASRLGGPLEVTVYPHSMLLYWWPVWVTGYILALLTWIEHRFAEFHQANGEVVRVLMHPNKSLGVIYTVMFLLVIVLTNSTVRGVASALVIAIILAVTFLLAYLNLWENILEAISYLAMYMNLGFYVFFSTAILIVWALAVLVFDRMEYWTFRPGQVVHNMVLGGGARTFDTINMSVYKLRSDLFRHWILGLGSGDLHIQTGGAASREFILPNVMFAGARLGTIERLVAMKPNAAATALPMTVGEPS